ncbi:tol-pal system YbgF family protein [Sabulicella rubraurantiaca]|uniref:hypothetical protein n=1 Tax=Sabulicella rubraurantiaca TaxID=2811429 RepID=UPI001F470303|nr:hypothetical protein [Sabulicella rubraurantiaca]
MAMFRAETGSSRKGGTARLLAVALVAGGLWAAPAAAQMDSREAIALQNQILQLRQEMEFLRRGGAPVAPPMAVPRGGPVGGGELVNQLLERVSILEEELRRSRGRVEVLENQNQRLRADVEKLQGDLDFRLSRIEGGGGGGSAPSAPARPSAPAPAAPAAPSAPPPRTPEAAIREGQAALARRDYATAEQTAREVLASRAGGAQTVNAQLLLGEALAGRRDFGNAAIAFNEAFTRSRTGPRAPEALLGLASAFTGLGSRREACDTLDDLRSQFPRLSGPLAERATQTRQRAQCR